MSQALTKPIRPDIDAALGELAKNGDKIEPTARKIGRAPQTLRNWRDQYPERYREHCENIAAAVERDIVIGARDLAHSVGEVEREALQATLELLQAREDKMPAATLQRLSTAKGINLTKVLELTGRPTQVVEHRDAAELIRAIQNIVTPEPESSITAEVVEDQGPENDPKTLEEKTQGNE